MRLRAAIALALGAIAAVVAATAVINPSCGGKHVEEGRSDLRFGKKERAAAAAQAGPSTGSGQAPSTGSGQADLDTLRTLPYVGFSSGTRAAEDTGVVSHDTARAFQGYTLFTSRDLCTTELIDMSGNIVKAWTQPGLLWANTKLLPNGDLLVVGAEKPDENRPRARNHAPEGNGYLLRLTWDNRLVWKRELPVHHDVDTLDDGTIVVLTSELRSMPEVSTRHDTRDDSVSFLSPEGELLESISVADALHGAPARYRFEYGDAGIWDGWFGHAPYRFQSVRSDRKKGGTIDLIHSNAARPIPSAFADAGDPLRDPANVLVTIRHQDAVVMLNRRDKRVVWLWGPGKLLGPHDATWLPGGRLLIFDNGLGRLWSRVVEVATGSNEIVWEYRAPEQESFYTASRGAAQRLPNGNTLITDSDNGRLLEVTSGGETVWEFWSPHRNQHGQLATITRSERLDVESVVRMMRAAQPAPTPDAGTPMPPAVPTD